jgi:hypothetical protein
MRAFYVFAALALTVPAAVSADPPREYPQRHDHDHDRDRDRDRDRSGSVGDRERYQRYDGSRWSRDTYRNRWVPLAYQYSAGTNKQNIKLQGKGGRFDRIRVEADRGAPVINQVAIEYLDGNTQVIKLNARLPRGAGEVIRLNGDRRINRIVVYTEPGFGGAYSVYGA